MSRKLGQIIAVREKTWMIRIPMGYDPKPNNAAITTVLCTALCAKRRNFSERRSMNWAHILKGTAQRFAWINISINGSRQ
jgi:hypothetical protein